MSDSKLVMSNQTYDRIALLGNRVFPILVAFYGTMSQIWKWGYEVQVMATLAAVQILLTGLLAVAKALYANSEAKYDGDIEVTTDGAITKLAPNTGFVDAASKDAVFRITKVGPGL